MNVTTLFNQINAAYRGSDDNPPTTGIDFTLWLQTANRKTQEWAKDSNQTWASLFSLGTVATPIAAGTQTYALDDEAIVPSDKVTVTVGINTYDYTVVKPQERNLSTKAVYLSGRHPQTLTFVDPIVAIDPIVGGTISFGAYIPPIDLVDGDSVVQVDDPYWLVYATAAELSFNDLTYSDKSSDLVTKANNLYSQMVAANRRGTADNPRTMPTRVKRILDPSHEYGNGIRDI